LEFWEQTEATVVEKVFLTLIKELESGIALMAWLGFSHIVFIR